MKRLISVALEIAESIEKSWGAVRPEVSMWAGMYGKTFDELRAAYAHRLEVIAADGPRPRSHESPERIRQQIAHFAAIKGAMDEIAQGQATSKNVRLLRSSAEALQRMWGEGSESAKPKDLNRTEGHVHKTNGTSTPLPPRPWHPDDGLTPIAQVLERFAENPALGMPDCLETLRVWLQVQGFAESASELDKRMKSIQGNLRRWEILASRPKPSPSDPIVILSPSTAADARVAVAKDAKDAAAYVRQLGKMILAKPAEGVAQAESAPVSPRAATLPEDRPAVAEDIARSKASKPAPAKRPGKSRKVWSHQHCPSCGGYVVAFVSMQQFCEKPRTPSYNTVRARVNSGAYWSNVAGGVPWCPVCKERTPEGAGVPSSIGGPTEVAPGAKCYRQTAEDTAQMLVWARGFVKAIPGCTLPETDRPPMDTDPPQMQLGFERLNDAVLAIAALARQLNRLPTRDQAEEAAKNAISKARSQDVRFSHQTDANARLEQDNDDQESEEG